MLEQVFFYFLYLTLIVSALCITYQDFKERAVYWWLYLLFFISLLSFSIYDELETIERAINVLFLFIQYLVIIGYYSIKNRRLQLVLKNEFGLGDVLCLLSFALTLQTVIFIYLYLGGLLTALFWSLALYMKERKFPSIPLAGIFTFVFLLIKLLFYISEFKFRN